MSKNAESVDSDLDSVEPEDDLQYIPPLPINRHDDLPEIPPIPIQLSDNEAIPSPSAKLSPPASPCKVAHRRSPLIHVPSEPLLDPSAGLAHSNSKCNGKITPYQ